MENLVLFLPSADIHPEQNTHTHTHTHTHARTHTHAHTESQPSLTLYLSSQSTLLRTSCKRQGVSTSSLKSSASGVAAARVTGGGSQEGTHFAISHLKHANLPLPPLPGCPNRRNERAPAPSAFPQPTSAASSTSAPQGDMGDKNAGKKLPRARV